MAFTSIKSVFARAALATPEQFDGWCKAWRVAVDSGSQESLLGFFCREGGVTEDVFLRRLADALGWPYLDLPQLTVPTEARDRISTKVAFQYTVLPVSFENNVLKVAVSNPFDSAMISSVQFEAKCPVQFGLSPHLE